MSVVCCVALRCLLSIPSWALGLAWSYVSSHISTGGGPDLPWHKKVSPFIQSDTAFPQAEVFLSTSPPPHRHRDLIICGSGTNVGICVRIRLDLRHLAAIIADAPGHTDTVVLMSNMYSLGNISPPLSCFSSALLVCCNSIINGIWCIED